MIRIAIAVGPLMLFPRFALADAASTAAQVRAADQIWEKRTEAVGPPQSFPKVLDPKAGMHFDGGPPIRGNDAIVARVKKEYPAGSSLTWGVNEAFGDRSDDMGVTTGEWRFTSYGIKPPTGRHVTVWRRNPQGRWKALMDIGVLDPNWSYSKSTIPPTRTSFSGRRSIRPS